MVDSPNLMKPLLSSGPVTVPEGMDGITIVPNRITCYILIVKSQLCMQDSSTKVLTFRVVRLF